MEEIYKWTVSAVIILAVGSIILFLSPSSSVSKSIRTVVVLCVLSVFLTPVLKIVFFDENTLDKEDVKQGLSEEIKEQMMYYAVIEAEEVCEDYVVESGCALNKIEAIANIDENNSIYISKVYLYMDTKYKDKENQIKERINSALNAKSEFIWETE